MKNISDIAGALRVIDSGLPGPTLVILGGVHGNERCGVDAVGNIVDETDVLEPATGKIILLFGNPDAIRANTRFVTHDLNRLFVSEALEADCSCTEHRRARELRAILDEADILLDIHASFTPASTPFLICEPQALPYLTSVPISTVCFGFDAVQPGGTDYYMNAQGKIGICVECGYLGDSRSLSVARAAIAGIVEGMRSLPSANALVEDKICYRAVEQYYTQWNVRLRKQFADFERVQEGEVIGYDGTIPLIAPEDCLLLFAHDQPMVGGEAFVILKAISPPIF